MADTTELKDVMTYDEAHYFNTGTTETPVWTLGGVLTKCDEGSNPKESKKQYIQDKSEKVKVTGFSNKFDIESDMVKNEVVFEKFYNIFRNRKTGTDAEMEHCIVELWNPGTTEGTYKARKITQTVEITDKTANPGEQMTLKGSLVGGDFIDGTFATATKTFTQTV